MSSRFSPVDTTVTPLFLPHRLIQRTSVVTLSVAGILKEVLTVILASVIFEDRLTPVNITGLCIAIAGIAAYNYIKYKSLKLQQQEAEAQAGREVPSGLRTTNAAFTGHPDDSVDYPSKKGTDGHDDEAYRPVVGEASDDDESDVDEERIIFSASRSRGSADHPLASAGAITASDRSGPPKVKVAP